MALGKNNRSYPLNALNKLEDYTNRIKTGNYYE